MAPQEHLHLFSLPPSLLDSLVPRTVLTQPDQHDPRPPSPPPAAPSATRACNICLGATFNDVDEQRTHFRSDWHRYNVKIRISGSEAVTSTQFAQLVDGLDESLSGSASSSDDLSSDDDAVDALVQKANKLRVKPTDDNELDQSIPNAPIVWFHSPPATQLGVYKVVFSSALAATSSSSSGPHFLDELKALQTGGGETGRKWALFMTAGGHFAGAIVRVSRPDGEDPDSSGLTKKGKPKKPKPDTEILLHKTFHRYTTRRKQGGAQSANDNSKSKAVSAGAMLRRYGEQALRDDIRNLLSDWADDLEDCERIFIRASVSNRKIFWGYDGAILQKDDDRLRTFPFPTRRPTQSELTRCLLQLTQVKISHLTEEALRAQDEEYLASRPKPKPLPTPAAAPVPKPEKPTLSPEDIALQEQRERWERALEMVAKGRVDALKAFLAKNDPLAGGVDARMLDGVEDGTPGETLLMYAAKKGQEDIVRWLLEEAHADPTLDVRGVTDGVRADHDSDELVASINRRTAYDLAQTRGVRDVFRRCAAEDPARWDWLGAARVPSALSREMEEGREEKKRVRRRGLKERVREREAGQHQEEADAAPPQPIPSRIVKEDREEGPRRLGGAGAAQDSVMGLTPEMRARIERERRARAAEARMRK